MSVHYRLLLTFLFVMFCVFPHSVSANSSEQKSETQTIELFHTIQDLKKDWLCPEDIYERAKSDLREAYLADQNDRKVGSDNLAKADTERRQRVAQIAAQGCLHDQEDYLRAALIFQHGHRPEHYLTAITYARKSFDLGQRHSLGLYEAAIDRYLMSLGRKQLFASQIASPLYYKLFEGKAEDEIQCLWPVDEMFDPSVHYGLGGKTHLAELETLIEAQKSRLPECDFPASESVTHLQALLALKI